MVIIHNTLSGKKEQIKKSRKLLTLFVCGPTVYGPAHLGHARVEIMFDIVARYVRAEGYALSYIQNITDIDDKIIARAEEDGITPQEVARVWEKEYLRVMKELRVTSVNHRARASAFIPEILAQIKRLIDKKFAYMTASGIYFEVRKFADYGKLSRQNLNALRPGWRIEPDPEKKDSLDFALWKFSKSINEIGWLSPWGRGRPGWHIEDTAITEKLLGKQYDIHGGGVDLKFPHHESEIAQQEAVSGKKPFVKIWMHVGMVMAGDEKMAKSKNNFVYARDFLEQHSVNTMRFMLASAHYRSPMHYSSALVEQAENALCAIHEFIAKINFVIQRRKVQSSAAQGTTALSAYEQRFRDAMNDDFNMPGAWSVIFSFMHDYQEKIWIMNRYEADAAHNFLVKKCALFGLIFKLLPISPAVQLLVKKREQFRARRAYAAADVARSKVQTLGYSIEDTPLGPFIKLKVCNEK